MLNLQTQQVSKTQQILTVQTPNHLSPIVKWVGGKRQIIDKMLQFVPKEYNNYFEPFVGGGAVFLNLLSNKAFINKAFINDINKELICIYKILKNKKTFNLLLKKLDEFEQKHSKDFYYEIRSIEQKKEFTTSWKNYEKAARTIYLNKSCFNGIYRVNRSGHFNVPWNQKEKVITKNQENIEALHDFFIKNKDKIKITSKDFAKVVKNAQKGDFVYFDPPYDHLEGKKSFTSYSKYGFEKKEQKRLAKTFEKLHKKEVKVMLSNHNTPFINELYKNYKIEVIKAKRIINSNKNGRGAVEEVLIMNY